MKTSSLMIAGIATAALLLVGPFPVSRAQDDGPKLYDLSDVDSGRHWEQSECVSLTSSQSMAMSVDMRRTAEGPPMTQTQEANESSEVVVKCLDVDEEGGLVRASAFVHDWSVAKGESEDTSLSGAYVAFEDGESGVSHPDGDVSDAALAWVADDLMDVLVAGDSDDEDRSFAGFGPALFSPGKPVAVGDTWEVDAFALLADLEMRDAPFVIDEDAGAIVGRLDRVDEVDGATIVFIQLDFELPVTQMGRGRNAMELDEGGSLAMEVEVSGPLAGGRGPLRMSAKGTLSGSGEMRGMFASFSADIHMQRELAPGGDYPEPPAADDE